jgi:hypothetical protein
MRRRVKPTSSEIEELFLIAFLSPGLPAHLWVEANSACSAAAYDERFLKMQVVAFGEQTNNS